MSDSRVDYRADRPLSIDCQIGGDVAATYQVHGAEEVGADEATATVSPGQKATIRLSAPLPPSLKIRVEVKGQPGNSYLGTATILQGRRLPRVRTFSGTVGVNGVSD